MENELSENCPKVERRLLMENELSENCPKVEGRLLMENELSENWPKVEGRLLMENELSGILTSTNHSIQRSPVVQTLLLVHFEN
jgi:hypothetical protein